MNYVDLNQVLENHKHWLYKDCEGWENMRADLRWERLNRADFRFVNLREADLGWAHLRETRFNMADLRGANLQGIDFQGADLRGAKFNGADLHWANLCGANLQGADLRGANLQGVDLQGANLYGALLDEKEKIRKGITLSESIIGWKKCKNNVLVKLLIPRGAIVFSINNYKCRTNKVKVLEVIGASRGISYYNYMSYYIGDEIEIFNFDCEYNNECAEGIHFFRTREEAEDYRYC